MPFNPFISGKCKLEFFAKPQQQSYPMVKSQKICHIYVDCSINYNEV